MPEREREPEPELAKVPALIKGCDELHRKASGVYISCTFVFLIEDLVKFRAVVCPI